MTAQAASSTAPAEVAAKPPPVLPLRGLVYLAAVTLATLGAALPALGNITAVALAARGNELRRAVDALDERQARVLRLRFGLDNGEPQTLDQVGAGLGITRERVRQLETRALADLRRTRPDLRLFLSGE